MSDIRFNRWLHQSGTGGVSQDSSGNIGIGSTQPLSALDLGTGNIRSHNIHSTGIVTTTGLDINGNADISGNLNVGGVLTYEDVTNIDSVGIITARSGIHVTGGKFAIGTDNPSGNLNISYLQVGKGQVSSDHSLYNYNTSFTNNAYQNGNGTFAHITSRAVGVINIQDNVLTFSNGPGGTAGQSATLTERLHIDSDGRLLLGTPTEGKSAADNLTIADAANCGVTIRSGTTNFGSIYFSDATTGAGEYDGYIQYSQNTQYLAFGVAQVERLRIASNGKVMMGQPSSSINRNLSITGVTGNSNDAEIGLQPTNSSGGLNPETIIGATADGAYGAHMFFTTRDTSGNRTERLRITSDGKIGINNSNPQYLLSLKSNDTGAYKRVDIHMTNDTTGHAGGDGVQIGYQDTFGAYIWNFENTPVYFGTNNSERLRITSDGDILIPGTQATSSETGKLDIYHTSPDSINSPHIRLWGPANNDCRIEFGAPSNSGEGGYIMYNDSDEGLYLGSRMATYSDVSICTGMNDGSPISNVRLRVSAAGYVTKPYQPAFNAKLSTSTGSGFTGYLVFNTVDYNIGSHYNNTNGRFTAPVSGRYLFSWYTNIVRDGGNGSLWGDWYVNSSARNNRFYTYFSGGWELMGATIILNLNTNDYVRVYVHTAGNYDGSSYGSFSGTLLS